MKIWLVSLEGAVATSSAAMVAFLGRSIIDWRFVYGEFVPDDQVGILAAVMALYMGIFGGWMWSILAVSRGERRGLLAGMGLNLFVLFAVAIATPLYYCPSPCATAWPVAEISNWINLIVCLLAVVSSGSQLRQEVSG